MPLAPVPAHIISAEDRYHAHHQHLEHSPAEAVVFRMWRHSSGRERLQMKGAWPTKVTQAVTAYAYVNHGRWMIDCPWGCNSAQYAARSDRRFFCVECDSGGTAQWAPVEWPDDLEVAAIEAALGLRPDETLRNWEPPTMREAKHLKPETAADLVAENKDHGVA